MGNTHTHARKEIGKCDFLRYLIELIVSKTVYMSIIRKRYVIHGIKSVYENIIS